MPTGVYPRKGGTAPPPAKSGGWKAVPFVIIEKSPLPLEAFGSPRRRQKVPVYRQALLDLASAKRGSVLCFDNARCLPQLNKQAKKIGYEIHVAEGGGKLYVQVVDTGDDK